MFRAALLLSLFGLTIGAGFQSVAERTKFGLALVGDELKKVELPGAARQIAINALLRSVQPADTGALSADNKKTLQNVTILLTDILTGLTSDRDARQTILDAVIAIIAACNDDGVHTRDTLQNKSDDAQDDLIACRLEEKDSWDAASEACIALENWLKLRKGNGPDCTVPPVGTSPDQITDWDTFLLEGKEWFDLHQPDYETKKEECTTASATLATKKEECVLDQVTYEADYCFLLQHEIHRCNTLDTCYANAESDHNQHLTDESASDNRRVNAAILIEHIICLCNAMIDDLDLTQEFTTICPMGDPAGNDYATNYRTTAPDYENKDSCTPPANRTKDDWIQHHHVDLALPAGLTPGEPTLCFL